MVFAVRNLKAANELIEEWQAELGEGSPPLHCEVCTPSHHACFFCWIDCLHCNDHIFPAEYRVPGYVSHDAGSTRYKIPVGF